MLVKDRERLELDIQSNFPPTHFPELFWTKRHATAPACPLASPQADKSRTYLNDNPPELTESPEIPTPESRAPPAFGLPPYVHDRAPKDTWSPAAGAVFAVAAVAASVELAAVAALVEPAVDSAAFCVLDAAGLVLA